MRPLKSIRKVIQVPAVMLVFALLAPGSHAQESSPAQGEQSAPEAGIPVDELDRGTPRRSLRGFLTATQNRDFETAAEYLDLRNLPSRMEPMDGPALAHGLSIVIDRELWIDFAGIIDLKEGKSGDGLPSYRD